MRALGLGLVLGSAHEEILPWALARLEPWPSLRTLGSVPRKNGLSVVLGFSFASGLRPHAKLSCRTEPASPLACIPGLLHWPRSQPIALYSRIARCHLPRCTCVAHRQWPVFQLHHQPSSAPHHISVHRQPSSSSAQLIVSPARRPPSSSSAQLIISLRT